MPNFAGTQYGVITRFGLQPSALAPIYGAKLGDAFVEALPVNYDCTRWNDAFRANWPAGSPAFESYAKRIAQGPQYSIADACRQSARMTRRPLAA
jgi:hypothetical protein